MAGRRYADDVSVDRYEDRRESHVSRNGRRYYEDRYAEEEVDYRRSTPQPAPVRERETIVREEVRERPGRTPAFLEEGYGRTSAGPVVLRKREQEDFEFAPRPRRRSPSPEPERKVEKEEIIIRRDESEVRAPPPRPRERERDVDREEIIIRRDERERSRPPPRFRERDVDREEIIFRRDEREPERLPPPVREQNREEIIIRRDERERDVRPPPPREVNSSREEIVIRRDEREREAVRSPPPRGVNTSREEIVIRRNEEEDRRSRYYDDDDVISRRGDYDRRPAPGEVDRQEIIIRRDEQNDTRRYDDYPLTRPKSHERARSRARRSSDASNDEIIIRQEEREGRNGTRNQQEIIIRRSSRSRSPATSVTSARTAPPVALPPPEPQVINAPTIHQEVITHHRHIDHGFEVAIPTRPRVIERPPSPPSPPLAPLPPPPRERARSEERIEISRTQTRNGRTDTEDIVIDRKERDAPITPRSMTPYNPPPPAREPYYEPAPRREVYRGYDRDVQEEAEFYNARAMDRAYIGESSHGATRGWEVVDVPPGTNRVRLEGAGGASQEITWQRYNGVRRSKFIPDGIDDGYDIAPARPAPLPALAPAPVPVPLPPAAPLPSANGEIGRRYGKERNPKEGLWTEVTKDLVVKEAIQEMGYEFEETDDFYYIIAYLRYEDIARLVGLSDDIRKERRKRIKEIEWENRVLPPPIEEPAPRPLAIEPPPPHRPRQEWDREEERYIEREVLYRGGRPPPPPGWRR